jgi:hypothetical protein
MIPELLQVLEEEMFGSYLILIGVCMMAVFVINILIQSSKHNLLGHPVHEAYRLAWKRLQAFFGVMFISVYPVLTCPIKITTLLSSYFNYALILIVSTVFFLIIWGLIGILGYTYYIDKLNFFDSNNIKPFSKFLIFGLPIFIASYSFVIFKEYGWTIWWQYITVVLPITIAFTSLAVWLIKKVTSKK